MLVVSRSSIMGNIKFYDKGHIKSAIINSRERNIGVIKFGIMRDFMRFSHTHGASLLHKCIYFVLRICLLNPLKHY